MAKTLVALYDTCTDAEQVVHELIDDGYARHDIHLALDHTRSGVTHASSGGGDTAYEEAHLTETLVDLGVPYDEVQAYREGVRRGGALVVVESSDAQAERGMAILRGLHPVDIHARPRSGGRRAGLAMTPPSDSPLPRRRRLPRCPAPRWKRAPRPRPLGGAREHPPDGARAKRRSRFPWCKKTSPSGSARSSTATCASRAGSPSSPWRKRCACARRRSRSNAGPQIARPRRPTSPPRPRRYLS